ncbi:hypothetical protein EDD86DRAFT_250056 [Gorgonomyces haynaldii]|nr:hypothetical protein EDD86DRAFT_250056 [Gorgonomyces haynaldii]
MFYKLNIVQQPTVARMSTSPKDKRLLNPPLVLSDVPDFDLYYCFATLIQTEESRYVDLDSDGYPITGCIHK